MGTSWRFNCIWSSLGCIKSVFGGKRLIDTERKKEENKMIEIGLLILILGGSAATIAAINS